MPLKIMTSCKLNLNLKNELNKGKNIIRDINNNFDLQEIFVNDEIILKVIISEQTKKSITEFAIKQNLETLNNRVNELGVAEPLIQQQGLDRIVIQLPGVQDTAKAKEILGRTATLEMRMVNEDNFNQDILEDGNEDQIPVNSEIFNDRFGNGILVKKEVILLVNELLMQGLELINKQVNRLFQLHLMEKVLVFLSK